jgi:L-lactate utilization protein LutC
MPEIAPPMLPESLIRQAPDLPAGHERLVKRWIDRATSNSMIVDRTTAARAMDRVLQILQDRTCRKVNLNIDTLPLPAAAHLESAGITVKPWGAPNCRDAAFDCDASLTDCRYGLADAGSLLVWSTPAFGRSSTLVTPVHIVLLPASRIIPDLLDALLLVEQLSHTTGMPSNVLVINGPSKTADIESKLITGVHGPKFLHVLVIDDL